MNHYGHLTRSIRLPVILFFLFVCLPTYAQYPTKSQTMNVGVITSYFGRHPKLQSFAEHLVDHIVVTTTAKTDVFIIPFELTPGQSCKGTDKKSFPKTHFQGGGDGHDNEAAMRYLNSLGKPWILITNGPSVSGGKRLIGSTSNNSFATVQQVDDGGLTLFVYFSDLGLQQSTHLETLEKSPTTESFKKDQSDRSAPLVLANSMHSALYVLVTAVAIACAISILRYQGISKKFAAMDDKSIEAANVIDDIHSKVDVVRVKISKIEDEVHSQNELLIDYDIFVRQVLHNLVELVRTSQSDNVKLHESNALKIAAMVDCFTHEQASILTAIDALLGGKTRGGAEALVHDETRLGDLTRVLDKIISDSNEVANLRQSLAEQVADVKKLDESVLSFASLLFRMSSQTEPNDFDQDTASYILGRLIRYFERVGINVIVPCVGDDYIDDLHSIHATVPATSDTEHMKIVDVHEIGLRRGSNVLRTASVTISIEGVSK